MDGNGFWLTVLTVVLLVFVALGAVPIVAMAYQFVIGLLFTVAGILQVSKESAA